MSQSIVHIVDDDNALRKSLAWLVESDGYLVRDYSDCRDFLDNYEVKNPECLLLDIRMPGMSGLELQEELTKHDISIPIVFLSAHGDVSMAVSAMKKGAVDFLLKPYDRDDLLICIKKAHNISHQRHIDNIEISEIESRITILTPRETQVMDLVVEGKMNKVISSELGIEEKTVEIHRSRVMRKMQAKSLASLVRMHMSYHAYAASHGERSEAE